MNTRACKLEAEDKDRLELRKLANSLISDESSEGVSAFSFEEGFGLDFFRIGLQPRRAKKKARFRIGGWASVEAPSSAVRTGSS
jgi:hypothetical protein